MNAAFVLHYHTSMHYFFVLRAPDQTTLLISKGYVTRLDALNAIEAVRLAASRDCQYQRLMSTAALPAFSVHAANNEVLAVSAAYSTPESRDAGIESVKRLAPTATLLG